MVTLTKRAPKRPLGWVKGSDIFFYHTNNMMEEGDGRHIPPKATLLTDAPVTDVTTIHQVTQSQAAPAESVDPEAQGIPFGPPALHHPQQSLSFCYVHSNSGDSHGLFGTEVSPLKKRRIGSPARSVATTGHLLDMAGALGTTPGNTSALGRVSLTPSATTGAVTPSLSTFTSISDRVTEFSGLSSLLAAVGQVSPEEPTNSEETQPSSLGARRTHFSNRNTNNRMVAINVSREGMHSGGSSEPGVGRWGTM